jgi:plastocyanin
MDNKSRCLTLALICVGSLGIQNALELARAATVTVAIGDNFFNPTSSTISVNDTVQWNWNSIDANLHSSTSDTSIWDSGTFGANHTFSRQFTSSGSFPYHCTVHSAVQKATITVQPAANVPPTVTITNPANGGVIAAPAAFAFGANASDSDGSVTNVQLRQGATILTNRTAKPYTYAISNLASGSYTFSAIASDNVGARTTNSVSITVNNLPTVAITNPASGAVLSAPAKFTLMASASDSDGTITNVQFLQGTTLLTNRASVPYTVTLSNLVTSNYTFSAIAADNRNGKATNSISVGVVTPVAVVLSSPQRPSPLSFQFNYSANSGLRYVIERSLNLTNWTSIDTNVAASSLESWLDTNALTSPGFYRVGRLPNP